MSGKELPGQRVALLVSIGSNFGSAAVITSISLQPQPGFSCQADSPELASLLPLEVETVLILHSESLSDLLDSTCVCG